MLRPAIVAVVVFAAGTPAWAQGAAAPSPLPSEVELSREQVRRGVEAARSGRWDEAREAFSRAYRLAPRPLTLLNLAGAQSQTGQLMEAAASYRRFLREAVGPTWGPHRETAQGALVQVERRIPHVRLRVRGLAADDAVTMD